MSNDYAVMVQKGFAAKDRRIAELEAQLTAERERAKKAEAALKQLSGPNSDLESYRRMVPDIDAIGTHGPIHQVYFRAGLLACREYMARFVECENPAIAQSIRLNWWPSLGEDPGPPRRLSFDEVAIERPDGRIDHADTPPSIEALARAYQFLYADRPALTPQTKKGEG